MPTRASIRRRVRYVVSVTNHSWVVREDSDKFGKPDWPSKPMVLVLEEPSNRMYALIGSLKAAGHSVQTLFEEKRAVTKIMSAMHRHALLLTTHDSNLSVTALLVVQRLRRRGYEWPITYCVKDKVSLETQSRYEELSVNTVLSIPAKARASAFATLEWVEKGVDLYRSGMTIVEF